MAVLGLGRDYGNYGILGGKDSDIMSITLIGLKACARNLPDDHVLL